MTSPPPADSMRDAAAEHPETARALAGGAAPRRWGSWYVAEHRIRAMKGYAGDALFQSFGNPLIYLFALGVGLASLVPQGVGDVSYLQFVAPALMATAAMTVTANETSYPVLMGFKWNPIFFGMNASPITGAQIVNGMMMRAVGDTMILSPPLIWTKETIDMAVERIGRALDLAEADLRT